MKRFHDSRNTRREDAASHRGRYRIVGEHDTDKEFLFHWPILSMPRIIEAIKLDHVLFHLRQRGRMRLASSHGWNFLLGRLPRLDGTHSPRVLGSMGLNTVESMWMRFLVVDAVGSRSAHMRGADCF